MGVVERRWGWCNGDGGGGVGGGGVAGMLSRVDSHDIEGASE